MKNINDVFEQLLETQMDYAIPVFMGTHNKPTSKLKKPVTLRFVDDESGMQREPDDYLEEEKSSTERVRRYYKRHPEKVRKYLRKTQDERVQRNRDRRKAVKKHGKAKMKNHDVHHPNGPGNGWRLAKKDHGRDKKDGTPPETGPTSKKSSPPKSKKSSPSKSTKPSPKKSTPVKTKKYTPSKKLSSKRRIASKKTSKKEILKKNIAAFVLYATKELGIINRPSMFIKQPSDNMTSLGSYDPTENKLVVVVKGRLLADILRTIAHELVHVKQMEDNRITNPEVDGATGSPIENEANAIAGTLMRKYSQIDKKMFLSEGLIVEGGAHANKQATDLVTCHECTQQFAQIQYRHLKYKHGITLEQYLEKYPNAKLVSESAKNYKGSGKNPMDNLENREKISKALKGTNKCAHFGDSHPFKKPENIQHLMGDRNPAKNPEVRKKISEGVKKSYTNELREIRSKQFKNFRNSSEFKERMYKLNLWTRPENKPSRQLYQEIVSTLSNLNYQKYFNIIPNAKLRSREWHLDHRVSVQYGFDNKIHPAIISHPCNLEVIHHSINESKGLKNSISYDTLIESIKQFDKSDTRILLLCGGAHGHLAHPFEDTDLSFNDFDEMIGRSLVGNLQKEGPVVEKMDGQNIAFTIRDGKVVFARNKGHLKNRAEKALPAEELAQMFSGRGEIADAFGKAAEDIEAAMSKLSPEEIEQVFGNGRNVMSTEIIYPGTRNVIPYDKTVLVFHGTLEHDDDGEKVGVQNTENGNIIAKAVTHANADKQRTFGISGPRTVAIADKTTEQLEQVYLQQSAKLEDLRAQYNLKPSATLRDYLDEWWSEQLTQIENTQGFKFSNQERSGLIARWVDSDKKFGVKNLSDDKKEWFRVFEKTELKPMLKKSVKPFEQVFLTTGVYALKRVVEFLSANNPAMAEQLKDEFAKTVREIQETAGTEKLEKLEYELARLKELGIDNLVPSEGLIFTFKGNPYKLTGAFAPVNQIMGTMKYNRAPEKVESPEPERPTNTEPPSEQPTQQDIPTKPAKPIAIYPGRFQPYHAGHQVTYDALVNQFGKENVFIGTSNKQDSVTSPFSFNEKRDIMTQMFGIPEEQIIQMKNPYRPVELIEKLPDNTPVIFALGEKDAERLSGGKYFQPYEPNERMLPVRDAGYIWIAPPPNLEVNGKEISGTQLRQVMGDPSITERAKKEIFTKVYGKFDQDIFNKIVKTTEKAEEARQLTAAHGEQGKKKSTKKPDEKSLSRARDVLTQKVKNPKTNRDILVATALKYSPEEPVRKAAEQLIQAAMQKNENLLFEEKQSSDNLKVYIYVKEPTDEDLEYEIDEYFKNERTLKAFPNLADSAYELTDMIKKAPAEVLDISELKSLENSDVGAILEGKDKQQILRKMMQNKKDVTGLLKDIKAKKPITMPVVIKHVSGYYLLGGNTRLSVLASLGHTMPVKVLGRATPFDAPISVYPAKKTGGAAKKKGNATGIFQSLLKMRITNPETGNEIKIDTAMDYNREHPAHKAAMAVIRQRMRGLSNRAGIPKNRQD